MIRKTALCACLILSGISTLRANSDLDDFFNNAGKIYVVVAVLAVIFFALILYLYLLDKKISKLEKEQSDVDKTH